MDKKKLSPFKKLSIWGCAVGLLGMAVLLYGGDTMAAFWALNVALLHLSAFHRETTYQKAWDLLDNLYEATKRYEDTYADQDTKKV